jgi:hypothetical protein
MQNLKLVSKILKQLCNSLFPIHAVYNISHLVTIDKLFNYEDVGNDFSHVIRTDGSSHCQSHDVNTSSST